MGSITGATKEGVKWIKFNRPEVYNSFNREMAFRFLEELESARDDETVRCIVITGEGKAFCAGQDLKEAVDPEGPGLRKIVSEHYNPLILKLRQIEKPIIAGVHGAAAGAGANIALACDFVLASHSAYFIQAFSKIGLIPDSGGTYFLPRLIGLPRATALMMLGEKLSADEAERIGMIYKSVPDSEFEQALEALATKLASMPTKGLGLTKRALNSCLYNDLDKQLDLEEQLQFAASQTDDYREGVQAFLEKSKPEFKGS